VRLPAYQDLSKEQDRINNLVLDGSHLVVGPPGTGKTVMALYRAKMLKKKRAEVTLLMYSRLLSQYTMAAVQELDIDGVVRTFHSWLWSFYRRLYRKEPPEIDVFKYDWTAILKVLNVSPPQQNGLPHLIIDEGQDLPKEFFPVARHLAHHLTVFADENQRLWEDNSTIDEIKVYSGIDRVHSLTRNYRNSQEIAQLAAHFYTGLETGIPDLPERHGEKPVMIQQKDLNDAVEFIIRFEHTNADLEIGVFTPTKKLQRKLVNRLQGKTKNPLEEYVGGQGAGAAVLNFGRPGIKVINFQSAKGLEFDAVFIPELQQIDTSPNDPVLRMKFYVLISRARRYLFLSYSGPDQPRIIGMLPKDLLEWR
jgi:superfamily I DNA/RNA helicase